MDLVAQGMAGAATEGQRAYAAQQLFGRGGRVLIPILVEQRSALMAHAMAIGETTGWTDKATEASRHWQAGEAELANTLESRLLPVMQILPDAVMGVVAAFKLAAAPVENVIAGWYAAWMMLVKGIADGSALVRDVMAHNFGAIKGDLKEALGDQEVIWKAYAQNVADTWKDFAHTLTEPLPTLPEPGKGTDPGDEQIAGRGTRTSRSRSAHGKASDNGFGEMMEEARLAQESAERVHEAISRAGTECITPK